MYARTVDECASRLRELRHEEREDLGVGALALGLAVVAAELRPALAMPLLVGGLVLVALGVRALWRRWDLVDRLAGDRDALAIPEVLAFAAREASPERRHDYAFQIRGRLGEVSGAARAELEALAAELDDGRLELDPACAVACKRLLSDPALPPPSLLRSRVGRIRAGFRLRRSAA